MTTTGLGWNISTDLALHTNTLNNLNQLVSGRETDMSKVINAYREACQVIPQEIRIYYTQEELRNIGYSLAKSLLADGKISPDEEDVLKALSDPVKWDRWWIKRDIYNSGMIDSRVLYENWDGDFKDGKDLSNFDEIMQGTNPLNRVETDSSNLSGRYAILIHTAGIPGNAKSILEVYHLLKKNGYDDAHITLFFNLLPKYQEWFNTICENPSFPWLEGNLLTDFPVVIDYNLSPSVSSDPPAGYGYEEITKVNFLNAIKNMSSDGNDSVFIYYLGHGNSQTICIGNLDRYPWGTVPSEMNEALSLMKYGTAVFVNESCESGGFVKELNKPNPLRNLVAIGGMAENESGGDWFSHYFFKYLEQGLGTKESFNSTQRETPYHPVIYFFGEDRLATYLSDNILIYRPQEMYESAQIIGSVSILIRYEHFLILLSVLLIMSIAILARRRAKRRKITIAPAPKPSPSAVTPTLPPRTVKSICPKCGRVLPSGSKFCSSCGAAAITVSYY